MPFICMAPSPSKAMAGRSGWANLAPMAYGTPGPMVASVPDSEPRCSVAVNFRCRAYQLAADPESDETMALAGSRSESSQNSRWGLTIPSLSLSVMAWRCMVSHQPDTLASTVSRQDRSSLRVSNGR